MGLILDSSVVIQAERNRLTAGEFLRELRSRFGETEIAISVITLAELVHGIERADTDSVRSRRREFIDQLKMGVPVLPVTEAAAEIAGRVSGQQAAVGVIVPFEDLLIAASALEHGYGVATGNVRDFSKVPGLTVVATS